MKRVLFITPLLWNGGAERVVSILSNSLASKGCDVGIFVYKPHKYDYYVAPEIRRFTFPFLFEDYKGNSVSSLIKRVRALREVIKDFKPEICIPFLDTALIDTWAASLFTNTSVISTCRNKPVKGNIIHELIRWVAFAQSKALFLQTEAQKQFFSDRFIKKSFVVNNPVDKSFLEVGEERIYKTNVKLIVSCGRLHKQKNHQLLIKSFINVHNNHPEVSLDIYGRGPEEIYLRDLINSHNAQDYIRLRGYVPDTIEVLKQADLFVLSSDYEGFPNAIIEAMAMGIPVCSTDCPTGPRDLIGPNGERGYLVPSGNEALLTIAINSMIEDVNDAKKKALLARKYVKENFSPDIISNQLLREISRVANM